MRQLAISVLITTSVALSSWVLWRARAQRASPSYVFHWSTELVPALTVTYAAVLVAATLMPLRMALHSAGTINLIPSLGAFQCRAGAGVNGQTVQFCLDNVIGNVLLFVPFGLLLPSLRKKSIAFLQVIAAAALCSTMIELLQLAERSLGYKRATDVNDVLLNVAGAVLGYVVWRIWRTTVKRDRVD